MLIAMGLTVGQAQEKLPKKVAQNSRVQDALKKDWRIDEKKKHNGSL